MRFCIYILIMAFVISCDNSAQQVTQSQRSDTEINWVESGICQVPNQSKSHGVMNCLVVDWQCPRCKKKLNSLRWRICESCCKELSICIVCSKKYSE